MSVAGAVAAAVYLLALLIVLEVWDVHRRHSSTPWGWIGFRSRPGVPVSAPTSVGFVAAALAGLTASLLSWAAVVPTLLAGGPTRILEGTALAGLALVLGLAARAELTRGRQCTEAPQSFLGPREQGGVAIRNPLFTAVIVFQLGVTVIAPSWLAVPALVAVIVVCHLQVRAVEEPYLIQTHGAPYVSYIKNSGRFVPRFGRRPEATTPPQAS